MHHKLSKKDQRKIVEALGLDYDYLYKRGLEHAERDKSPKHLKAGYAKTFIGNFVEELIKGAKQAMQDKLDMKDISKYLGTKEEWLKNMDKTY